MILQWSQRTSLPDVVLQWQRNVPEFKLQWRGPNLISTEWLRSEQAKTAVSLMELIESKIAVIAGPQGERGLQGEKGDTVAGEGTIADATFSWSPQSAQAVWVINHTLGKFPSVTVVDSTGRLVIPEITYLSMNLVQISFAFATSGTAYLN